MTFPNNLVDRELQKFVENPAGETSVRVLVSNEPDNPVNISGDFVVTGLKVALKTTTMDITDTSQAVPTTPLSSRNSLSIQNKSNTDTIYIGQALTVEANSNVGTLAGWEIGPNETWNVDVTDAIILYAIAEAGKTVRVKVLELA